MKRFPFATWVVLVLACLWGIPAAASVVISGTRVIFNAAQAEATIRLTNNNPHPALVEAWIDHGDINATPDTTRAPFLITPPLFRMDAHKDQSLRILYVQGRNALPGDRESLFWLNVLEVPPKATGPQYAGKNVLQFAIRSRIKLFYRPPHLAGDSMHAPEQLRFKAAVGEGAAIEVHNPTPYYITISSLALGADGKPVKGAAGMVAPFGDLRLPLAGLAHAPAAGTPLTFVTINDYGAGDSHQGIVAQ